MTDPLNRQILAAQNNAIWCDTVCRAHGCPCEYIADAWLNRGTPPRYYSNLVTMRGGKSAIAQEKLIREIVESEPGRSFGFKDSFSCIEAIELSDARMFTKLFDATWIWLEPATFRLRESSLQWERMQTDAQFLAWERTWRGDAANQSALNSGRQFPASLLEISEIAFLGGKNSSGEIIAVAAANRTSDVVGLSNVFGPGCSAAELWAGATQAALNVFPVSLPLVGYERGDDLRHALDHGFEPVGSLRVWVLS